MKYFGQHSNPKVDEYLHREFFSNTKNGFFIECGAFDGLLESNTLFFERFMEWKGINVEPHPDLFTRLVSNRPNSINLNVALTSPTKKGNLEFCGFDFKSRQDINLYGKYSGLGHVKVLDIKNYDQLGLKDGESRVYNVNGITYKDLIEFNKVSSVNLFVLDAEGSEIDVIEGMIGCSILPDIMCVEYGFIGLNNLTNCLSDLGYKKYSVIHNNAHYVLK